MVSACSVDTYSSDLQSFSDFSALAGDVEPLHPNGSQRLLQSTAMFYSSRPKAEHSYSHNQNQFQTGRRNGYNGPSNDPLSIRSNDSASMSTSSMPIVVSRSLLYSMGQQKTFPSDEDPRLQYSYPAPQQAPQPYQSYRDPLTSYSNHPTTPPPICVFGNHSQDERWQPNPYGGTSVTNSIPETVFLPAASYPGPSFQYPTQNPPQGMPFDPRLFIPVNIYTIPSTSSLQRGPVSVERTATRSSAHTTTSPYPRNPPAPDHSPPKKRRSRADAKQLRVLNKVYTRTAFPSTEQRQELAAKLNMTPRSVQIWFQNKRQWIRNTHRQSASIRGPGPDNPSGVHHSGSGPEMTGNGDSVHISEICFDMCETLNAGIQGNNADDLDESVRTAPKDLERCVDCDKERVESHKLEIKRILSTLATPGFAPDEKLGADARVTQPALADPPDTTSASEAACERLIRRSFTPHELPPLIEAIFLGEDEGHTIHCLRGDDAQTFIDVIDEALDRVYLLPKIRKKCLKLSYRMCGQHAFLPKAMKIHAEYDRTGFALYRGGSADVWKGIYCGRDVAVKVIRTYSDSDPRRIIGRFCKEVVTWKTLRHPNVLPLIGVMMSENRLAMVSDWMLNGNINDFMRAHPDVDRLALLSDVAKGLCYLHSCDVIHGGIRGSNILVDCTGHARITGFGNTVAIEDENVVRSDPGDYFHIAQWAAPETSSGQLEYGKEADIFSFAMVMIEVFTGTAPFGNVPPFVAVVAIMQGGRPPRPTHPAFTEELWTLMQQCWDHDPHSRPKISDVLQILLTLELPAWKRLISPTLSAHDRISLITSIFLDRNEVEVVGNLSGYDAQTYVNVVNETLDGLPQLIRRRCLRSLYRICACQALLPRSLTIPPCYNPMETPQCHGGFADVWKGQYEGTAVACKVLKIYENDDLEQIRKRFCKEVVMWNGLRHRNVLPLLGVTMDRRLFVMVSEWMKNGNINEFVKEHSDVNRLELLEDATRGLIYMHDQGIMHGDLKGANILIGRDGRALLADFSLITVISYQSTSSSSRIEGGSTPWMSPELLDPESFGLTESRPTKSSDCYALGMVMYEVLSGHHPFFPRSGPIIMVDILDGKRPRRPEGGERNPFTDDIWAMLELCWKHQPSTRTSVKAVLSFLGDTSLLGMSGSEADGDVVTDTGNESDDTTYNSCPPIKHGGDIPIKRHDWSHLYAVLCSFVFLCLASTWVLRGTLLLFIVFLVFKPEFLRKL